MNKGQQDMGPVKRRQTQRESCQRQGEGMGYFHLVRVYPPQLWLNCEEGVHVRKYRDSHSVAAATTIAFVDICGNMRLLKKKASRLRIMNKEYVCRYYCNDSVFINTSGLHILFSFKNLVPFLHPKNTLKYLEFDHNFRD